VHPQRRPPSRSPPGSTPAPPRSESKVGTPAHLHPARLSLPLGLAGLSCRRLLGLPRSRPLGLRCSSSRLPPVQPLLVSLRRASGCPHGELPSAVLLPYGLADSPRRASGCRCRTTSLRPSSSPRAVPLRPPPAACPPGGKAGTWHCGAARS
jgi:hypothetical protein